MWYVLTLVHALWKIKCVPKRFQLQVQVNANAEMLKSIVTYFLYFVIM